MVSIRGYISVNFTKSFLTVFIPFFLIISLIYLVQISLLTAKIQISFPELIQLFSYYIPAIIFYSLPISFIASLAISLLRLSGDNELIALFASGYPVNRILYPLWFIALLFSILLLIISLGAMPQSKQLYASFKHIKKEEMAFNVIPKEIGQKFGNHYIYMEGEKNNLYQNMVIFSQDKNGSNQIFVAHNGDINKQNGIFSLTLFNGRGYTFEPNIIQQIDYQKLIVYDTLSRTKYLFEPIKVYWERALVDVKRERKLLFSIFISLIPILSLYILASLSIINPRYQKNRSFMVIGAVTIFFYTIASILDKIGNIYILIALIFIIMLSGYMIFNRTVSRYF
ncbi:MAG: LptF/LptG family permease [Sulfurovum sp.]|nr:LptF/LptG family permease [Sulfurovaceae bacterium]